MQDKMQEEARQELERLKKENQWRMRELVQDRDFQLKKQQQTFELQLESVSAENDRLKQELESVMDREFER